jgi:sugar O-acyltransferase (sialic acid O-acetyltransferase NeuD family)
MKPIVLIGGGGHCRACIDVIEEGGVYRIVGILDALKADDESILGYPILGRDDELKSFASNRWAALVTVGHIKNVTRRIELYQIASQLHMIAPPIISNKAYLSRHSLIGAGTIIMHGAVINAAATVGDNCILNTQSLIEHDVRVGSHCHISTGARLNGGVTIGDQCFIGSGVTVKEGVNIGHNSLIGAGLTVLKDVNPGTIFTG